MIHGKQPFKTQLRKEDSGTRRHGATKREKHKVCLEKCCQRKLDVSIGRHFSKSKRGRIVVATVARNSSIARPGVPTVTPTWL